MSLLGLAQFDFVLIRAGVTLRACSHAYTTASDNLCQLRVAQGMTFRSQLSSQESLLPTLNRGSTL